MHVRTDIGRDGSQLILKSGTALPARCVKTNEPIAPEELVTESFSWCSPWASLMILVSGPLLVITYFLARKKCTLTYGIRADLNARRRMQRRILKIAAIVLFLALPFVGVWFDHNMAVPLVVLLLFIATIVALFVGNAPLSVTNHREGQFLMKGFSPEFLNSVVPD